MKKDSMQRHCREQTDRQTRLEERRKVSHIRASLVPGVGLLALTHPVVFTPGDTASEADTPWTCLFQTVSLEASRFVTVGFNFHIRKTRAVVL